MENKNGEYNKEEYEEQMIAMAKRQKVEHDAKVAGGAFIVIGMTFVIALIIIFSIL